MKALRLPWSLASMPHATLDILRGCTIQCRACYNNQAPILKPLKQVREELEFLSTRRHLQCVTIVGGEPTLHPDLPAIVRMISDRGLHPVVMTNGLQLQPRLLEQLRDSGTAMVMAHVDSQQTRPDLPAGAPLDQVNDLRQRIAETLISHGIQAGMLATGYCSRLDEIISLTRFVIESPSVDYLLVTNCTQVSQYASIEGDLYEGLRCNQVDLSNQDGLRDEQLHVRETDQVLQSKLGLHPFAYLSSSHDLSEPRWLSYLVGTVRTRDGQLTTSCLTSSLAERLAIHLIRLLSGRYLFYQRESPLRLRLQMLLNGLTGGRCFTTLGLLMRSLRPGAMLRAKHLLFQSGPTRRDDGQIVHCFACPDATVRNGRIVPLCLSDRVGGD